MTDSNSVLGDQVALEIPTSETAYMHWRKTGELPDDEKGMEEIEKEIKKEEEKGPEKDEGEKVPEEKTEEVSEESEVEEPSEGDESAASHEEPVTKPAESGAAKPQQKITANERIRQLNAENKRIREESVRRERELLQKLADRPAVQEKKPVTTDSKTAEAAQSEPQIDDKDEKGEAKYKTWADFQKAYQKWQIAEIDRRVDERLNKRGKDTELAEAERLIHEGWNQRVTVVAKEYPDFQQVALNPDLPIVKGSPVEQYILESENGPRVLYYLGQHPDELSELTGLSSDKDENNNFVRVGPGLTPAKLYRQLSLIELSLMPDEEEPVEKKPVVKTPVAKPVTKAPPPSKQISGKAASSKDVSEEAVEGDNFEAYAEEANRRDIARRKALRARGR